MNLNQEYVPYKRIERRPVRREKRIRQFGKVKLIFGVLFAAAMCLIGTFLVARNGSERTSDTTLAAYKPPRSHGENRASTFVENESLTLFERYGKIVWLDAGHGGRDSGTSAVYNDILYKEKDIALNIVLMVYEMFELSDSGVRAFLSRANDTYISAITRPDIWNATADLVVSVHVDYYEGPTAYQVSGIQVNYYDNGMNTGRVNLTDAQFAQIIQNHLVDETGARDRRIRGDRGFWVCSLSTMPALLIEAGFMSNPDELSLLVTEEYQRKIAVAIYNAIVEAFQHMRG